MKNNKFIHFEKRQRHCVLLGAATAFMFCIFAPLDAFFANRDEFWFSLPQLLPALAIAFLGCAALFSVLLLLLHRGRAASWVYGSWLYAYLFFYIQGNFVPRDYGVLNGAEINWADYGTYGVMSVALAVVCILLWIVSTVKLRDRIYRVGRYLCVFILLIQAVTIGTVWIRDGIAGKNRPGEKSVVTNKDMLNLSGDNNVLVFILDTFDAQDMLDLLQGGRGEEYRELFGEGFTFYPDTLGAYPTTKAAVPQILTGIPYYNEKPYADYIRDAYRESPVLKALRDRGYSVGLYTEDRLLNEDSDLYINVGAGAYYVKDYPRLALKMYQLAAFNYMPHQLKRFFCLDTGEFEELKETSLEGGAYSYEVQPNYAVLLTKGISVTESGNCFRLYHTAGVHPQYTFGKDLVTEAGKTYDVLDEAEGNCTYLKAFFDELRKEGIYESSTIVIMADHGHYEYSQNPLFMIKNAGENDGFVISEEKMSFACLPDILVSLIEGQEVTEEYIRRYAQRERNFLYYTWDDSWERAYLPRMQEIRADGYAGDVSSLRVTGREYIGRDNYTYSGEVVSGFRTGEILDTVYFYSDQYNADKYAMEGLSWQEEWGTWTDGGRVVLSLPLQGTEAPFIGVNMDIHSVFYQPQSVIILVNGRYVGKDTIAEGENLVFAFENPGTDAAELTLLLPDSVAVSEVMESEDPRKLALGLLTMEVTEAEYALSTVPGDGMIRFDAKDYNAHLYVLSGIASPQEEGTWTVGGRLSAQMALNGGEAERIHISMDLAAVAGQRQEISVEVNGEEVFAGEVSAGEDAVSFSINRPEDDRIFLTIHIPGAAFPAEMETADDSAGLGLMMKRIRISP